MTAFAETVEYSARPVSDSFPFPHRCVRVIRDAGGYGDSPLPGSAGEGHAADSFTESRVVGLKLVVFDVGGRVVRTLVDEPRSLGGHEVVWDGRSDIGQFVASGIYFYKMIVGNFVETRKMVILK